MGEPEFRQHTTKDGRIYFLVQIDGKIYAHKQKEIVEAFATNPAGFQVVKMGNGPSAWNFIQDGTSRNSSVGNDTASVKSRINSIIKQMQEVMESL